MAENNAEKFAAITSKAIRLGINKGWSWSDFTEKYGCTKHDLIFRISSLFKTNKDRKDVIGSIDANEKIRKPKKSKKKSNENKAADVKVVEAEKAKPEVEPLDGLVVEETRLSEVVMMLENEQKSCIEKHHKEVAGMQELSKEIDRIKSDYDACVTKYKDALTKTRAIEEDMEKVLASKKEAKAKLEEVRKKISDLTHVVIFVYANGNIEVQEGEIELDYSGYEDLFISMRDDETYETLRVIDIKSLAKVISIRNNAKKSASKKIEFMFDNEELENYFKAS